MYEPAKKRLGAFFLACALLMTLFAGISIAADTDDIKVALPENPVVFNEALDEYVVTWEPVKGIREYHVGVYYCMQVWDGGIYTYPPMRTVKEPMEVTVWQVAEGYLGTKAITDGAGSVYMVEQGIWESITLPGDAAEVDIARLINHHMEPVALYYDDVTLETTGYGETLALLECTMVMVAVRENGEPIVVSIEIPIA